tara:strand:+ start:8273 stop:8440 length:168 start_codon:yes stop_codon:yes gene_type:complete
MDNILPGNSSNIQALVDELDEVYPLINPTPRDNDKTIMYRAGQRSVVEYILDKLS